MNWEAIGAVAELIGAVAVLVTLVFLTLQLRYANVLARSSASSVQSTRMMDRFLRVAESDGFAALLTKEWDSDGLSDIEKTQITYYVAMLIHNAGDAFRQWHLGVTGEVEFMTALSALRSGIMNNHTARSVWAINRDHYGRGFASKFEEMVYPEGFSTKPEENLLYKKSS